MTEADQFNELGQEMFALIPRGWLWVLAAQSVAIGGALLAIAGATWAFLYGRPMTWARAALGGALFTGLMLIIFGLIPNQWLTLTQATLEWTPQRVFFTVPGVLVLNNDVSISYAALKDAIAGGYILTMFLAIALAMYGWQEWQKRRATTPKPTPVSRYGRPLKVGD